MKKRICFVVIWMLAIGLITRMLQFYGVRLSSLINAAIIAIFFLPLEVLLHYVSKNSPKKTNRILSKFVFLFIAVAYFGGLISTVVLLIKN